MWSKIFETVRYTLAIINFVFLVTGIILLGVGISVQNAYNGYHSFLSERFLSLPAFCIATGVIIFIIAFFGFYGAYKESYFMILAYAVSMALMFVFVLAACIAGYVLKGNTVSLIQQQLYDTLVIYKNPNDFVVTKLWDEVQEDFSCCGVKNASDWLVPLNTTEYKWLPVSCCQYPFGAVHNVTCALDDPSSAKVHSDGCSEVFGEWVQDHIGGIASAGAFLIVWQALTVGAAIWLAVMMRSERGGYP
ncbi:hypothetical protein ACJJTC_008540 [Scirpophaga incertulas]